MTPTIGSTVQFKLNLSEPEAIWRPLMVISTQGDIVCGQVFLKPHDTTDHLREMMPPDSWCPLGVGATIYVQAKKGNLTGQWRV